MSKLNLTSADLIHDVDVILDAESTREGSKVQLRTNAKACFRVKAGLDVLNAAAAEAAGDDVDTSKSNQRFDTLQRAVRDAFKSLTDKQKATVRSWLSIADEDRNVTIGKVGKGDDKRAALKAAGKPRGAPPAAEDDGLEEGDAPSEHAFAADPGDERLHKLVDRIAGTRNRGRRVTAVVEELAPMLGVSKLEVFERLSEEYMSEETGTDG